MTSKTGKRHPLLTYRRLFGAWRAPSLLIALLCGMLWWVAPPPLNEFVPQVALLIATAIGAVFFLYALVGPRLSYVQCRSNYVRISTPLFRLAISYSRIRSVRPVLFDPRNIGMTREWLAEPYQGQTAVALDLTGYPIRPRWLRFWFDEFLLPGDFMGFVLLTPDWMTLSRDIDVHRSEWKHRRRDVRPRDALTRLMPY